MLYFTILFFFSRVVRLFRANQQKKASLSLVKITEEFKMQVIRQESIIKVQALKFILYIRNPSLRNPEKRLQTLFSVFLAPLPPSPPPPPLAKNKKKIVSLLTG